MGELQPGDYVLSDEGAPTQVSWISEVEHNPEAWEFTFDDGARLISDAGHQWVTLDEGDRLRLLRSSDEWKAARRARREKRGTGKRPDLAARNSATAKAVYADPNPRGSVRTTREIVATLNGPTGRANHCIVNPQPLSLPHAAELPIDPYVLGAWLGDGTSRDGGITSADIEVIESVRARGYVVTRVESSKYGYNIHGLTTVLRRYGLASNKHIPRQYLRASFTQRLALLQGLCDTDGYACATKGSVEFTTTSPALRDGMLELLATLGIKPSCRAGVAKLNGRETGPKWRIQFWTTLPAFELQRKLARQRRDNGNGRRSRRYITDARRVPPEPMRCIAVDAPSHCYLAGREMIVTHNSWALAYEAARYATVPGYTAVIFRRTTPELTGGGSIWEESKGLYPHAGGRRRESPTLDWFFESGAWIGFRHLQHADTVYEHQGKQYAAVMFDEITHFDASQFWYMLSRVRSSSDVPRRIRGTCNPDPDSFVRELIDWWIGPDGLAIEERSGVIRWLARVDERLVWGDTPEAVWRQAPHAIRRPGEPVRDAADDRMEPLSFTFIRAKATDNRIGLERDPGYLSRLALLPGAERERLLKGNWNARDTAGDYFNRNTFPLLDRIPRAHNVVRAVRFWDKAATTPSASNPDPDWTRGALVALLDDNTFALCDLKSERAGPGEIDALMQRTAEEDGRFVEIGMYQDPAQAGKVDVHHSAKLFEGYAFHTVPALKSLTVYARAWVNIARDPTDPTKPGRFKVVRTVDTHTVFKELESFPYGSHDDIVACISGAMQVLTDGAVFDPAAIVSGTDKPHALDSGMEVDDVDDDDRDHGWNRGGQGGGFGRGGRGAYV